ncbi:MAG: hypothetical protein P8Y29_10085 [Gemmatimonadota bacterium]|jgi:hypothetical protein
MHCRIPIVGVVALFVAVSCNEQPVEPQRDGGTPSFSKGPPYAVVEPVPFAGLVSFVACANDGAGEDLLWVSGTIDAHFWGRETPSGNVITSCVVDYDTGDPPTAVGQDSGDEWVLVRGEDNCRILNKPGTLPNALHDDFQANEWYVNQDGEKLHGRIQLRIHRNPVGDLTLFRYLEQWTCVGKP